MGLQTYTGLLAAAPADVATTVIQNSQPGFPPKAVILSWSGSSSAGGLLTDIRRGIGFTTGVGKDRCVMNTENTLALQGETDRCIRNDALFGAITPGTADPQTIDSLIATQAFPRSDDNGFDVIVNDATATTINTKYLALGGSDIDAEVFDLSAPLATGAQAYTLVDGRTPIFLIFISSGQTAFNTIGVHSVMCHGVASGPGTDEQWVHASWSQDSPLNIVAKKYGRRGECVAFSASATTALTFRASLQSFDDGGFTLNWLKVDGATQPKVSVLAFYGEARFEVGFSSTVATRLSLLTPAACGFRPKAICMAGINAAESTADTPVANDDFSVGYAVNPRTRGCSFANSVDGSAAEDTYAGGSAVNIYSGVVSPVQSVEETVDITTFNYDGFTPIQSNTPSAVDGPGGRFLMWWAMAPRVDEGLRHGFDELGRIYRNAEIIYTDAGNVQRTANLNQGHASFGDAVALKLSDETANVLGQTSVASVQHYSTAGGAPYWSEAAS